MDIGSRKGFPAGTLSNFSPHPFVIDKIECASMEGFLQSLKFKTPHIQVVICKLTGITAKRRGRKRNKAWKRVQKLWWQGKEFDRHGKEFQGLLDRAFDALSENEGFRKALLATGNAVLTHKIGSSKKSETVLTEAEFCSQLTRIREKLKNKK